MGINGADDMTTPARETPKPPARIVSVRSTRRPPTWFDATSLAAWWEGWKDVSCCCCGAGLSRWAATDEHGQVWGKDCINRALGRMAPSRAGWAYEMKRAEEARIRSMRKAIEAAHKGQVGTRYVYGNLGSATLYADGWMLAHDSSTEAVFTGKADGVGSWFRADDAMIRATGMELPSECLARWIAAEQKSAEKWRAKGDARMASRCLGEIERLKADYAGWAG